MAPVGRLDAELRFRARGKLSYGVIGAYVVLLLVIVFILIPRISPSDFWVPYVLVGLTVLFLARYLSVTYTIDDEYLRAWKILGGSRVPLDEIRGIEYSSLRALAPTGGWFGVGAWGWHGRMWSPSVGEFESVYTDPSRGILITAGAHPLYVSPVGLEEFARELSRRARSYSGALTVDIGAGTPSQ
jgi:hypothetical protein